MPPSFNYPLSRPDLSFASLADSKDYSAGWRHLVEVRSSESTGAGHAQAADMPSGPHTMQHPTLSSYDWRLYKLSQDSDSMRDFLSLAPERPQPIVLASAVPASGPLFVENGSLQILTSSPASNQLVEPSLIIGPRRFLHNPPRKGTVSIPFERVAKATKITPRTPLWARAPTIYDILHDDDLQLVDGDKNAKVLSNRGSIILDWPGLLKQLQWTIHADTRHGLAIEVASVLTTLVDIGDCFKQSMDADDILRLRNPQLKKVRLESVDYLQEWAVWCPQFSIEI